jgi:hypothetical protein
MRPEPLPYNVKEPKLIRELTPEKKKKKSGSKSSTKVA